MRDGTRKPDRLVRENEALRRRVAALEAETERSKITLESLGDAVISTDASGRITQMNPVAEKLTGWAGTDARGKPLDEVFRIVNEETRAEVESPVAHVLRDGLVVGLANHTLLIAKDGSERPIADSGAPIRNEKGETTGVVLVFRDQTEERAAQKALRESEETFRALAENANEGIVVATGAGLHVFANRRAAEITGYSVDDLLEVSIKDLANAEEFNKTVKERYERVVAGKPVPREYETIIVRKDSENVPVEVTSAKTNWHGRPADLVIFRDIRERRRTEEALRASEARFSTIFHASPIGLSTTRLADGRYVDVNEAFLSMFGYTREEAVGRTSIQLLTWASPEERDRVVRALREQGRIRNMEAQYRRKSGEIWTAVVSAELIEVAGEQYSFSLLQDITERKRMEAALRESEERTRTTLHSLGDAVISTDAGGSVLQMNPVAEKLTGWAGTDARGKPLDEVFRIVNEETRAEVESPVAHVLRDGLVVGLANHTLLIAKDGSERPIADSGAPIRNEKGEISGVVLVFRDQTEERAAQKVLQESEAFNRTIVESIPQKLFLKDRNGVYLAVNQAYATSLGYEPAQLVGKDDFTFYTKELAEKYQADDRAVMESGWVKDIEERYLAQGKEYWVHTVKAPVKDDAGYVTAVLGLFEDITDRKRIEQSLKDAWDRLEEAQRAAHLGNWEWDAVKDEITGSKEFYRLFDVAPEVLARFSQFLERLHHDDRERVQRDVADALKQDRPYDTDYRVKLSDGGWRDIIARGRVFAAADGKPVRMVGTCLDITERKQMEAALRESEQRLRRFYESGLLGVIYWNTRGQITDANDKFLEMVGYTRDDLATGRVDWGNMTPPEYRHLDEDSVAELKATGVNKTPFEKEYVRKDGTRMPIAIAGAMLDKERVNGVAFVLDITERKRMEERISHLNLVLKAVRNVNQLIVREKDAETLIRRACEVLTRTRGYFSAWIALHDESGKYLTTASAGLGEAFESLENRLRSGQLAACGKALHERGAHVVRNPAVECPNCPAAMLYKNQSAIAVRLEHEGHLHGLLVMAMDAGLVDLVEEQNLIEEVGDDIAYALHGLEVEKRRSAAVEDLRKHRDELEQRVRDRTTQLEESNKELEAFSYSVSHDLRAPLRAIDGFTRILADDYASHLNTEGKRLCSVVHENTGKMSRLIDDLLAFSRLGRAEMSLSRIDMGTMARSVFYELTTPESRARIDFQVGTLPPAVADPTLLRQVWMNLLSNAIKFSSKRERAVIKVSAPQNEGESVYAVQDNGAGFDMRYVQKLFGVFQRLHSTREFEGTGVGLALVQRVIRRHGGRIWADGEPDKGAAFYFALPRKGE